MWDNVPLLRITANLLFGLSLVLALYGAARYVLHLPVFPLNTVSLSKTPTHVPVELIQRVVHEQIKGNFFTVDLAHARAAFEQLPWVRKVSVRRKFPWSLEVDLEEHVAFARWNEKELVNTYGEVFAENSGQVLPEFVGQPNTSSQMKILYDEFNKELSPMKQQINRINLSPRFSWQVRLNNGMVLELGREQMQQRLARFVEVYPYSLPRLPHAVTHVDLRYRNGFATNLQSGAEAVSRTSGNKV